MGAFDALRHGEITHGYFGSHTSTIDWCETNYATSPYIAEFVNTMTNVPTIAVGVYAWWVSLRGGIRKRYALTYLGLCLIGIGSFGFHASLMWEWQLMDELPMIYVASHSAYLILDTLPEFSPRFGLLGPLVLISWDVFVTFSYLYLPNPVYHQIAFAAILISSIARSAYLLRRIPAAHPARAKITRTLIRGCATFAGGFAIWNVDNIFCEQLRAAREVLGVWGVFLQGHGYWHLMTGYGSLLIFAASTLLQLCIKVSPDAYDFNESAWFPVTTKKVGSSDAAVASTEKPSSTASSNGTHAVPVSGAKAGAVRRRDLEAESRGTSSSYEVSEDEVERAGQARRRDAGRVLRSGRTRGSGTGLGNGLDRAESLGGHVNGQENGKGHER